MRDRIKGLKRIPADKLIPHPENWRIHPDKQRKALSTAMDAIGWADAIIARQLEDGTYQILDGHLRAEQSSGKVPVLVVDLDDDEAKLLLASHDSIGAMAQIDSTALRSILAQLESDNDAMNELLSSIAEEMKLPLQHVHTPDEFKQVDVDIETNYQCPKCSYRWSGKTADDA